MFKKLFPEIGSELSGEFVWLDLIVGQQNSAKGKSHTSVVCILQWFLWKLTMVKDARFEEGLASYRISYREPFHRFFQAVFTHVDDRLCFIRFMVDPHNLLEPSERMLSVHLASALSTVA